MIQKKDLALALFVLFAAVFSTAVIASYLKDPLSKLQKEANPFAEIRTVKIPILMYHYVEYNQDENDFLRNQQNVPPHIFEQQIINLKNAGYTFITPRQIPKIVKSLIPLKEKYIVLSFDDGFRDFYTDAYPILKKHEVPAVNYVVYNFIDRQDYMTAPMVAEVADDPLVEVGSHTLNHAYLLDIRQDLLEAEVSQSKEYLEQRFGIEKVESFAYPYGNYDEISVEAVKNAGYTTAVTVEPGTTVYSTNLFTLKRLRPGHLTGQALLNFINQ